MTNRDDVSADLIVLECQRRGIDLYRFNSEEYPVQVGLHADPLRPLDSRLIVDGEAIHIGASGIWIWRPEWPRVDPELATEVDIQIAQQESVAAFGGVLRLLADRCVSPPDAMQAARWKINQLAVAKAISMRVPASVVTSDPKEAADFASTGPTIVKAVSEARVALGSDEWLGYVSLAGSETDWESVTIAPVLLQKQVLKVADLRVTVVGERLFAVQISTPPGSPIDFRAVDSQDCRYQVVKLGSRLEQACLKFLRRFGLRFGAFDFAVDANGDMWFLECNPAGQWGWLESFAGVQITAALVDLLVSLP